MDFKAFNYPILKDMRLLSEYNYYVGVNEEREEEGGSAEGEEDIDLNAPELEDDEESADLDAEIEGGGEEAAPDGMPADTSSNEVEIDVTDLVAKQDEMKNKYDEIVNAINGLKASYGGDLKNIRQDIDGLSKKIQAGQDSLAQELKKRAPTPNEKLELRSMSSFPYSVRLSDYWKPADEKGQHQFDINNNKPGNYLDTAEKQNSEYILKMSDVYDGYNEHDIAQSM